MYYYFKDENGILYAYEDDQAPKEGLTPITEAEKDSIERLNRQSAFNALSYSEKRRYEYPPITEYIDGVVKGNQEQVQAYIQACLTIKSKYPKP